MGGREVSSISWQARTAGRGAWQVLGAATEGLDVVDGREHCRQWQHARCCWHTFRAATPIHHHNSRPAADSKHNALDSFSASVCAPSSSSERLAACPLYAFFSPMKPFSSCTYCFLRKLSSLAGMPSVRASRSNSRIKLRSGCGWVAGRAG